MRELEQTIRERAYQLWIESGCLDGNAETHWLSAQREVLAQSLNSIARVVATPQAKPVKREAKQRKRRAA
jgi:hypothetical protein